jgi:dynein intermediate chain 2
MPKEMPKESYIWNLQNPNFPQTTLLPPSPLCCMSFNPKSPEIVVGGSYNGSLSFFDTRRGSSSGVVKPIKTTILEKSHHDPVYNVEWITTKSGSECVSSSTDGRLLWWDYKDETGGEEPLEDKLILNEEFPSNIEGQPPVQKVLGASALSYCPEASAMKYLIGTE